MQKPTDRLAGNCKQRDTESALLALIEQILAELRPSPLPPQSLTIDSRFEQELGLDSLSRMELLTRVEKAWQVSLPETLLATADTPRQLLAALGKATGGGTRSHLAPTPLPKPIPQGSAPHEAQTLVEVLQWHVAAHAERTHILLDHDIEPAEEITYRDLLEGAQTVAAALRAHDHQARQAVAIMLPSGRDYFYSFFGILLAGGIPVPIYPPARLSQVEEHLRRHARILDNAQVSILLTWHQAHRAAQVLRDQVASLKHVLTPETFDRQSVTPFNVRMGTGDIAFLQYTSGSTGDPKGVVLSHANLLANIRAMAAAVNANSNDVFVSWLPLYHDMGLIGAWLGSLYLACPLVVMSPLSFLARPQRWLRAIQAYQGTLSAAPNFAYELCLHKLTDDDLTGLDLSSWRLAFNGAEPVSPQTLRNFSQRFAAYGFRPEVMTPVYGLAENSVGLAFPPLGRGPVIDRIVRDTLATKGLAVPAAEQHADSLEFVACGFPLAHHKIRIVDEAGRELPDRQEGRLQFQGPSATTGYFRNPSATSQLVRGDWLDSGDLAYTVEGEIYLTSRVKDLIIRAGRNIYPHEVEQAVGEIPGIRKGCVSLFGSSDDASGTEKVVVLAETRETDPTALQTLREQVRRVTTDHLGTPADAIVLAPPHSVLKTSSGKVRRTACRALYEQGKIGRQALRPWQQWARLAALGLAARFRSWRRLFVESAYAAYAWTLLGVMAPPVWLLVVLAPRMAWRWAIMRHAARLLLYATRTRVSIAGLEHLNRHSKVVLVANHASYVDGIILTASLPVQFGFIAKKEFADRFIAGMFLRRMGSVFVERFDALRSLADVRYIAQTLARGRSLLFFPEGTFDRAPGLLPFRMGAFVTAAQAGVPIIPIVLQGTRSLLRADSWFPRRGRVKVTLSKPVMPQAASWKAAAALQQLVRSEILRLGGEPDLDPFLTKHENQTPAERNAAD